MMRDFDRDRETYVHLLADVDDAERAYIAAKDAVRRFQLEIATDQVAVGDVVRDGKGELRVTAVRFDYMRPDDARRSFGRPHLSGVRRRVSGEWGQRVVDTWNSGWTVVQRKEQADA